MPKRLLLALALAVSAAAGDTLLLLRLEGDLEKSSDLSTVNGLYRDVWQGLHKGDVVFGPDSIRCSEKACALALAREAKAGEVIFSTIRRLGEKWIFSSTIVETAGGEAFNQRATALGIEDLEPVTRRVAEALKARTTLEEVATTENITAKEEHTEPTRRRSLFASGLALGYLYPMNNSYAYLKRDDRTSPVTFREVQPHGAMIRLNWMSRWEFRDDMALNFDAVWALPNDLGADITLQYLFGKGDVTPFIGGGLGVHYIVPDGEDAAGEGHRHSGPTPIAQAGILLFRTYDIHLIARAQYQATFNSDVDNGVAMDVGVIYQPKEKRREGGGFIAVLGWTALGILVLGAINAVTD